VQAAQGLMSGPEEVGVGSSGRHDVSLLRARLIELTPGVIKRGAGQALAILPIAFYITE
jgi:hypothetical protein